MASERKRKAAAPRLKPAPKAKRAEGSSRKPALKIKKDAVKASKTGARTKAPAAKKSTAAAAKPEKRKREKRKVGKASSHKISGLIIDPIGDVTSGEAHTYLGDAELPSNAAALPSANVEMAAFRAETAEDALDATLEAAPELAPAAVEAASEAGGKATGGETDATEKAADEPRAPARLERLQKILSRAGIASRRHAEEMITEGRVIVNGQVVTTLGSKADPARDHIRVDGKLLHGAERHRYFMLNKPKGYVTTVSDPEGRQTVMEFFAGLRERLYPVGRLDYQSEGLLLMTNDGELANLLAKAGSGVEKTYLVKVAGQPSEDELERLRAGVAIEKGEAGSERVRTSPARIRPVREGDNPWFEVVLIEGRNRELRKMFSAIGHFVEKIRRVGYGPLVLDIEPGKQRELTPEEVNALRLAAEGKWKPRRAKTPQVPPAEARRAPGTRFERPLERAGKPEWKRGSRAQRSDRGDDWAPKREGQPRDRKFRPRQSGEGRNSENQSREFRGGAKSSFGRGEKSAFDKRRGQFGAPRGRQFGAKPEFDRRRGADSFSRPGQRFDRPAFPGRPPRQPAEPGVPSKRRFDASEGRPFRAHGERPYFKRTGESEKRFDKTPGKNFGPRPSRDWSKAPRAGAGETGGKKFASSGRFDSRSGPGPGEVSRPAGSSQRGGFSKPGGFSRARAKGPGFRGKYAGGKRQGFRPSGKPGGGNKRG